MRAQKSNVDQGSFAPAVLDRSTSNTDASVIVKTSERAAACSSECCSNKASLAIPDGLKCAFFVGNFGRSSPNRDVCHSLNTTLSCYQSFRLQTTNLPNSPGQCATIAHERAMSDRHDVQEKLVHSRGKSTAIVCKMIDLFSTQTRTYRRRGRTPSFQLRRSGSERR